MKLLKNLFFQYSLLRYSIVYWRHAIQSRIAELRCPNYLDRVSKEDVSPIFIVGAGRSGNTLLARLLHETGGVHFDPENYTLKDTYLKFHRFGAEKIKQPSGAGR